MLKHKSLVMVSILVLVLAVVAMSCAPAKPATPPVEPAKPVAPVTPPTPPAPPVAPVTPTTPEVTPPAPPATPAVEITTSYEAATYTDDKNGFSIKYPKSWAAGEVKLSGGVFYATGTEGLVYVAVRPATDFKAAALTFLMDLIALKGVSINPDLESEAAATFADGKTKGTVIMLSALFGSQKASVYGVIKDGKAIMVMCGTAPKSVPLYKEIGATLSVK